MTETSRPTARQDLYRHVNGEWLASAQIPSDQGAYGAFMELRDASELAVRRIAEDAARTVDSLPEGPVSGGADDDGARRRIGALYASFMDEERVQLRGLEPILTDLADIESVQDLPGFVQLCGRLQREGVSGLVDFGALNDAGNPERMLLHVLQGGLGLPDESYYREEKFAEILAAYRLHVGRLFTLAGIGGDSAEIQTIADQVVEFEAALAAHHWDVVKSRDAVARYNLMDRAGFLELFPLGEHWLRGAGLDGTRSEEIVVWQPNYLSGAQQVLQATELTTLKHWLDLQLLHTLSPYLPAAFQQEHFDFYGRRLAGTEEDRPRWKRAVAFVNSSVGEDVARLYVAKHFPEGHRAAMDRLVNTLMEAYRRSISTLDWMGEQTRQRAVEKLSMFTPMVSFPVKWIDYSSLTVDPADLIGNLRTTTAFAVERDLSKIETGPDPEEWHMTPQTVNAYYSPLENAIVFPAAILQPPFFDPERSAAENFGAIGAVIGHEIGHGFDDQGSHYAGDGSLQNWWTDEDRAAFEERTAQLVDQYEVLSPAEAPDHHVNGRLTLGENIGDLGGLGIAYQAYRIWREENPDDAAPVSSGPDAEAEDRDWETAQDRAFFASWAACWRQLTRTETAITRITSDPHAPNEFRCNQVVKNLDAFHEAYGTQPDDPMWLDPEQRVTIW